MGSYQLKGPTDSESQSIRVDDGCTSRQPVCVPGPTDGAVAGHAGEEDPSTLLRRAGAVLAAYDIGRARAPAAIVRETGLDDLPKLADTVISGMLQILAMVAATTALGALVGGLIGACFAGVGAVPGAAVGADIGFDAGMAVLTWLGLGALAVTIARGLGEVTVLAHRAVVTAWDAEGKPDRPAQIDAAGQCFADAIGKLMLLVMIAIVARLTVAAGEAATSAASELIAALRRSRLGAGFAAWVETNSTSLMRNPRLRAHREMAGSSASSQTTTPSELKASTPRPIEPPPGPPPAPTLGHAPKELPSLRQAYVDEVAKLKSVAEQMRKTTMDNEQIARAVHAQRRALGEKYKSLTPPDKLAEIYARNESRYGDKLGPTIEWLRARGKTWDQIIESATRTGGKDLGF